MKRLLIIGLAILASLNFVHAQESGGYSVEVVSERNLKGIPSASGLESKGKRHYVVGDDSPWLYELDTALNIQRRLLIHDSSFEGHYRIPKDLKPDYEAIVNFKWGNSKDLLIFGSGSGELRKDMVKVKFTGKGYEVKIYTLEHLYDVIMEAGNLTPGQLNIEGAASWRDHIIFMNRETNQLILIRKFAFMRFMKWKKKKQQRKSIKVEFYDFELPKIDGVQAQFSGGMKASGEHTLIFTASAERREGSEDDGENVGSFIGEIALNKLNKREMKIAQVMKDGRPYLGKIESVDVVDTKDTKLKLEAVTDDDRGGSTFLEIKVRR